MRPQRDRGSPREAINDVLAAHQHIRDLCDHGWVHLLAMADDGVVAHHHVGHNRWEAL